MRSKVPRTGATTRSVLPLPCTLSLLISPSSPHEQDLLLVSEVLGGVPRPSPAQGEKKQTVPFTGTVEVKRRRVLKDGRVKLKLSLLGVPVDRCGACLSQFRKEERAALTPVCKHT